MLTLSNFKQTMIDKAQRWAAFDNVYTNILLRQNKNGFGRREIKELKDKYGYYPYGCATPDEKETARIIDELEAWVKSYTGEDIPSWAMGYSQSDTSPGRRPHLTRRVDMKRTNESVKTRSRFWFSVSERSSLDHQNFCRLDNGRVVQYTRRQSGEWIYDEPIGYSDYVYLGEGVYDHHDPTPWRCAHPPYRARGCCRCRCCCCCRCCCASSSSCA